MHPNWKMLVRSLRMHCAPRRLTSVVSLLAILTLLFSLAGSAQPALAVPPPPTVNGLFWGDGDHAVYKPIAWGVDSDTVLYRYIDTATDTLYVALVVDGNVNDNVFDPKVTDQPPSEYVQSAGWIVDQKESRPFTHLINSEYAGFTATICDHTYAEWKQGYARQIANDVVLGEKDSVYGLDGWVSNTTIRKDGGTPPISYTSSSSIVWNMNNYAGATPKTFEMDVHCDDGTYPNDPCKAENWKSPFHLATTNTVTNTGGFPEVISSTSPISFSVDFQWEWAMVYEWSASLDCADYSVPPDSDYYGSVDLTPTVSTATSHHSKMKSGINDDDPTPVTLVALSATDSTAILPIAGLLVSAVTIIVSRRRRRRR